jgi:hypothetical protein
LKKSRTVTVEHPLLSTSPFGSKPSSIIINFDAPNSSTLLKSLQQAASDPVALTRLLADIDEDKTGKVTESEFLGYFCGLRRTDLDHRLKEHRLNHTYIRAIQVQEGSLPGAEWFTQFEFVVCQT